MRLFQKYVCEICNSAYDEEEHAKQCEARGIEELKIKVGDLVWIDLVSHDKRMACWWQGKEKPEGFYRAQVVNIRGPFGNHDTPYHPYGVIGEHIGFQGVQFWGYGPSANPHVYLISVRFHNFDKLINSCNMVRDTYLQSELLTDDQLPQGAKLLGDKKVKPTAEVEVTKPETSLLEAKGDAPMKKGFFAKLFGR